MPESPYPSRLPKWLQLQGNVPGTRPAGLGVAWRAQATVTGFGYVRGSPLGTLGASACSGGMKGSHAEMWSDCRYIRRTHRFSWMRQEMRAARFDMFTVWGGRLHTVGSGHRSPGSAGGGGPLPDGPSHMSGPPIAAPPADDRRRPGRCRSPPAGSSARPRDPAGRGPR